MEQEEQEEQEELSEYSSKSDFSKAKIVYDSTQKCMEARGKEMKKGYYNIKRNADGSEIKTWIPDTRQVYIGCVNALRILLSSEILVHEKYKTKIENIKTKIKEIEGTYAYEELKFVDKDGGHYWIPTERKFIPELESHVVIINYPRQGAASVVQGGWDSKINLYWETVMEQYDEMLELLNQLINKLNYFKQKSGY